MKGRRGKVQREDVRAPCSSEVVDAGPTPTAVQPFCKMQCARKVGSEQPAAFECLVRNTARAAQQGQWSSWTVVIVDSGHRPRRARTFHRRPRSGHGPGGTRAIRRREPPEPCSLHAVAATRRRLRRRGVAGGALERSRATQTSTPLMKSRSRSARDPWCRGAARHVSRRRTSPVVACRAAARHVSSRVAPLRASRRATRTVASIRRSRSSTSLGRKSRTRQFRERCFALKRMGVGGSHGTESGQFAFVIA
jgi:hypothetical protein